MKQKFWLRVLQKQKEKYDKRFWLKRSDLHTTPRFFGQIYPGDKIFLSCVDLLEGRPRIGESNEQ